MRKSIHPDPRDAVALRFLAELERGGGGCEYQGVRGWALREDAEHWTGARLPERLPRLHARGFLDRADVRVPSIQRPRWIWRINALGAAFAGAMVSSEHSAPLAHPDRTVPDARVYIPPPSLRALQVLRDAVRTARAEYIASEPGWRTMSQLVTRADSADSRTRFNDYLSDIRSEAEGGEEWRGEADAEEWTRVLPPDPMFSRWDTLHGEAPGDRWAGDRFSPEHVHWLVKVDLAQVWPLSVSWRAMPVTLYRVTAVGASVLPLDWAPSH